MLPLSDGQRTGSFPIWTIILIMINVFVFILELTVQNMDAFFAQFALIPQQINFLQTSTLSSFITAQFLHGGFLHIISNMWFLWIFGDNVEDKLGKLFFPFFYLVAGVLGNLVQYLLDPSSPYPILGASGAIAGVLGAYYAFFPNQKIKTLVFIFIFVTLVDIPASFLLFYWFILQLFSGAVTVSPNAGSLGGVAYFAHIGGFASGWLIGKLIHPPKMGDALISKSASTLT